MRGVVVLDTHTWVWSKLKPDELSSVALDRLMSAQRLCVSAVSIYEVTTLVVRGRIVLDLPLERWLRAARRGVDVISVSASIASRAGGYQRTWSHGDPMDRLIASTADELDGVLVTKDEQLHRVFAARAVW